MRAGSRTAALLLASSVSAGCFYSYGTVDLLEFDRRGVSLAKIDQREQSARKLGTVRASERSFLFGNCDTLAGNALEELLANARASGGTVSSTSAFGEGGRGSPKCCVAETLVTSSS